MKVVCMCIHIMGCILCGSEVNITYVSFQLNSFSLVIGRSHCGLSSTGRSHLHGTVLLFDQLV